jgi:hypothetical protein
LFSFFSYSHLNPYAELDSPLTQLPIAFLPLCEVLVNLFSKAHVPASSIELYKNVYAISP